MASWVHCESCKHFHGRCTPEQYAEGKGRACAEGLFPIREKETKERYTFAADGSRVENGECDKFVNNQGW